MNVNGKGMHLDSNCPVFVWNTLVASGGQIQPTMNKHIYLILVCYFLSTCKTDTNKTSSNASQNMDSLLVAYINQMRDDSVDCSSFVNDSFKIKGLFKGFCPSDTIKDIPISLRKTQPFDTLINKARDTITYSFKVSGECCLKYYGQYHLDKDTLILTYGYCGRQCDCYCDYILTYKIPADNKFKHAVIRRVTK